MEQSMKEKAKGAIKTWFVTGASSGVGQELCLQLLDRGYNVIAVARRLPSFDHTNALCLSVDVTIPTEVELAVYKGIQKFGSIDVLSNNAGITSLMSAEEEFPEKMRQVMEVNFWGTYNTVRALLPHFRNKKNGTIINNTSIHGISPRTYGAAYCSSKHAVEGLTSVLWLETKSFCRVMAVEMTYFAGTEIGKDTLFKASKFQEYTKMPSTAISSSTIPFKAIKNNLHTGVSFIIDAAEQETLPRRLMLGKDIVPRVEFEIASYIEDLNNSREKAFHCGEMSSQIQNGKLPPVQSENKNPYDCALMTTYDRPNYGGVLTSYALFKVIANLGYSPIIIKGRDISLLNKHVADFTNKYLIVAKTDSYTPFDTTIKTFIVGSDCMWSPYFWENILSNLLPFAGMNAKKISYAPSFGTSEFIDKDGNFPQKLSYSYKYYLDQFDHISVREDSGVNILKNIFNLESTQVLDPVFLLDKEHYFKMIHKNQKKYIASYLFSTNTTTLANNKSIQDRFPNHELVEMKLKVEVPIEQWLSTLYHSDFFVTSSFHGLCFAIIFNKNFVILHNYHIGSTRMESLLKIVSLENRLLNTLDELDERPDLFDPIDWDTVNKKLLLEKEHSLNWLKNALDTPKIERSIDFKDFIIQELHDKISSLEVSLSLLKKTQIENIKKLVQEHEGKNVIFYGAGYIYNNIKKYFKESNILTILLAPEYIGNKTTIDGVPVLPVTAINTLDPHCSIIICNRDFSDKMQHELETQYNIDSKRIHTITTIIH